MANEYLVVGHFRFVDDVKKAILWLKENGLPEYLLYSPVPNHELEDEIYKGKLRSPVRLFTLFGGITGCLGAFLMTCWMSLDWPMRTSAKTILSIPAFVVIAFECTILIGAIVTLLGMFHLARIPNIFSAPGYRADFSKDVFGLTVRVSKEKSEEVKKRFTEVGAKNVEIEYVR